MLRIGSKRNELRVVNDQTGCPTPASGIADALLQVAALYEKDGEIQWGTYHYCGSPPTTWYDFAEKIFEIAATENDFPSPKITPIATKEYPTPAKRPQNSVLDCGKIETMLHINPCRWEPGLISVIRDLCIKGLGQSF